MSVVGKKASISPKHLVLFSFGKNENLLLILVYTLVIYIYMCLVSLAALFGHKKARLMRRGQRATWKILRERIDVADRPVWFHVASLGEFEQGRLLIERLKREHPEQKILLTFFSPSGYEVRKNYEYADAVCYLPFDTKPGVRKFLRLAHPAMAVFVKYEFWANYLFLCHQRDIPVYSVSSIFRPSQLFFRPWNMGYSRVLWWVTHFFVQNEASRLLLARKGLTNVTVTGDTRLDRVVQIQQKARSLPLVEAFVGDGAQNVFVAGSSWPPDEDVYLPYFAHKGWKLIIASHEISTLRIEKLRARCEREVGYTITYGEAASFSADALREARVLLVDCFGLLSSIYRYGTVAYVGGGFGVGIHNVPEAAVYGLPVLFGPNNKKFQEAQTLLARGGAFEVGGNVDFAEKMDSLLSDPKSLNQAGKAAAEYIHSGAGAVERIYKAIFNPCQ